MELEGIKSTMRASGSQALAESVVCGIDECAENGHPLSEVQKIDLVKMAIMSYDKILEACDLIQIEVILAGRASGQSNS